MAFRSLIRNRRSQNLLCRYQKRHAGPPHRPQPHPNWLRSSIAVLNGVDNGLILHFVQTGNTIEEVAHAIAIQFDGTVIEPMRRAAQPSSSP